jgi:hypothetical protein
MSHLVKIGGREVVISWNQETAKRYNFRLSCIGGHPTKRELTTPALASAAVCKLLWALLPASEIGRYATPEDLFVDIDQDTESEAISLAIIGVFADMAPTKEKKTTSQKSPSQKSS